MRASILALAFVLACSAPPAEPVQPVKPVDERVLHSDTHATPPQRQDIERALSEWTRFSRGRVRITARWDLDDMTYLDLPPPWLHIRARSDETGNYGGTVDGQLIILVPETCPDLQACMMHETGHLLGLAHFERLDGQVMSAHNPARVFGVADRRECVRVGVCRATKPDVTTVTVTVDPAIPLTSPEYP